MKTVHYFDLFESLRWTQMRIFFLSHMALLGLGDTDKRKFDKQ